MRQLPLGARKILIDVLSELTHFQTPRERRALVEKAVGDYPPVMKTLQFLDWSGPSFIVATDLVRLLEGQEVAPGIPALALLLLDIQPLAGAKAFEVAHLRKQLGWGAEFVSLPPDAWKDARPAVEIIEERIIGENTLRPIYYLRRALRAADAVVRVDVAGVARGTGFLVSPNLVMTNRHVFRAIDEIRRAEFVFFNELHDPSADTILLNETEVRISISTDGALQYCNEQLDFVLVRLAACAPASYPLQLKRAIVSQNERVVIIQHPGGYPKQVSLQNNLIAFADHRIVQYYTSTRAGSSGSPVLDDDFAVIAIHTGWVHNKEWAGDGLRLSDPKQVIDREYRNQGTSMAAVLDDLKAHTPQICRELTII